MDKKGERVTETGGTEPLWKLPPRHRENLIIMKTDKIIDPGRPESSKLQRTAQKPCQSYLICRLISQAFYEENPKYGIIRPNGQIIQIAYRWRVKRSFASMNKR
ncbi:hypothetical protein RJZ57_000533 [Blastomyces gilchristii]